MYKIQNLLLQNTARNRSKLRNLQMWEWFFPMHSVVMSTYKLWAHDGTYLVRSTKDRGILNSGSSSSLILAFDSQRTHRRRHRCGNRKTIHQLPDAIAAANQPDAIYSRAFHVMTATANGQGHLLTSLTLAIGTMDTDAATLVRVVAPARSALFASVSCVTAIRFDDGIPDA